MGPGGFGAVRSFGASLALVFRRGEPSEAANPAQLGNGFDSLAVLPFVNDSGDAMLDYLSDGLSEDLIDRLYRLPKLKVMSRDDPWQASNWTGCGMA